MKPRVVPDANLVEVEPKIEKWVQRTKDMFGDMDASRKRLMWRKMQELLNPNTTSLNEPSESIRSRGRPKKSKNKGSTKREPSAFEVAAESRIDSCSPDVTTVIYDAGPVAPEPMFKKAKRPPRTAVSTTDLLDVSCIFLT